MFVTIKLFEIIRWFLLFANIIYLFAYIDISGTACVLLQCDTCSENQLYLSFLQREQNVLGDSNLDHCTEDKLECIQHISSKTHPLSPFDAEGRLQSATLKRKIQKCDKKLQFAKAEMLVEWGQPFTRWWTWMAKIWVCSGLSAPQLELSHQVE